MQEYKIEFSLESLVNFRDKMAHFIEMNDPDYMSWITCLQAYILTNIYHKVDKKVGQMSRNHKKFGSMKFNQMEIDVVVICLFPFAGEIYAELLKHKSGRVPHLRMRWDKAAGKIEKP